MTFEENTLDSNRIYDGKIINLRKDKVTVKTGTSYREIVEHNGGAVLIGITDEKKMLMVKQYRYAAKKVMFEVPAGKIDKGEDPLVTASRELKEETGFTAGKVEYLMHFYPTVGYSEEILYLYLCTDLQPGETDFDLNEAIDTEEWDIQDLYKMVMEGEIDDGKTALAILQAKALMDEGRI